MDIIETDLPPASTARIAVEPAGDFRVYFGAESFSLLNATNIESLPFYLQATPAGQYSFTVDPGQFAFFAAPARDSVVFSVGYFTEIGSVISEGILYSVYRSNVPGLGTISFEVSL
jgi:hypothetical protein